jgi:hypothetical protein
MLYKLYGLFISSDEIFPELTPISRVKPDIKIRYLFCSKLFPSHTHWFMKWHLPGGKLWLSFAKINENYLLRFNKLADFLINKHGRKIVCLSKPGIPKETIQHLLLDQVIPLVINLRGGEALHASAVLSPQGVIAFIGPTGSGKSTIAASLLLARYPHLSDDCLTLFEKAKDIYAIPAYPGLRLWEDSLAWLFGDNRNRKLVAHYTDKLRPVVENRPRTYCTVPKPLRRLYSITPLYKAKGKNNILIEALTPRESFMALVQCAFRLDIKDNNMLIRQFHFLGRVASKISVRRLIFPRDFNLLAAIREAIVNDLKDLDN